MSTTDAAVPATPSEGRIRPPVTVVEGLLLATAFGATLWTFPRLVYLAYTVVADLEGYAGFFSFALLGMAVPGFVIPFLTMMIIPWRYKIVGGVLSTFVLMYYGLRALIQSFGGGVWALGGESVRFAFLLSGALVALAIWGSLSEKRFAGAAPVPTYAPTQPVTAPPRTSLFLQFLALISVPAIYAGIVAGALITVGIGVLLIILISEGGRLPVWILIAAYGSPIAAAIGAVYALYRALVPVVQPQLTTVLPKGNTPELWSIVTDVCARVGTRVPDHMILHALPTFYVMQGRAQTVDESIRGRILAIGAPLVRALSVRELQAVLAHEFAHFSGRDTLYSSFTARVFNGLHAALHAIRTGADVGGRIGVALYLLQYPAFQYIVAFYRYLMSLNMVISRSRELRADWYAAHLYGSLAFTSGLEKAVGIGAHFNEAVRTLEFSHPRKLYVAYQQLLETHPASYRPFVQELLAETENEFSSHPRLQVRIDTAALVPTATESSAASVDTSAVVSEVASFETPLAERLGSAILQYREQSRPDPEDTRREWDGSLENEE